jgi:hypothetical protein
MFSATPSITTRSFDILAAIDDDPLIVQMWAALGIVSTLVPEVGG